LPLFANPSDNAQILRLAEEGLEPPQDSSGNSTITNQNGAECGALGAKSAPFDPGLAAVVDAWPRLSEAIKAGILAMIRIAQ
jgi:hypothetical protein